MEITIVENQMENGKWKKGDEMETTLKQRLFGDFKLTLINVEHRSMYRSPMTIQVSIYMSPFEKH